MLFTAELHHNTHLRYLYICYEYTCVHVSKFYTILGQLDDKQMKLQKDVNDARHGIDFVMV